MPADRASIVNLLKRIHLFRNVEDARLEIAADLMEEEELRAGQTIFAQGAAADYFYIIESGAVQLSRAEGPSHAPLSLGLLEEDDYFGQEMLDVNLARQVTAEAVTDVVLLRVLATDFNRMIEHIPSLGPELQMVLDSYKLMLRTGFSWREDEEAVLFIARRHIFFLFRAILAPLALGAVTIPLLAYFVLRFPMVTTMTILVLFTLAFVSWFVWNYIDWTNDYYVVTSRRVLYQERVVLLYDSRLESPLPAIQSTTINTTQLGRWLGYGNVAIRTFYGTLLFRDIPYPEQVMAFVQQQQLRAQFSQRKMDIRSIGEFLDKRIRSGPQRPSIPGARVPPPPPDFFREFISTLFHLRMQNGKTIIYRTHWFVLLKKIGIPTLILAGLAVFFILSLLDRFAILSIQATCGLLFLSGGIVSLWWFYQYMDWHNDLYLITADQVVDVNKKPLGQEERQAAPIKNILSIEYKRVGMIGLFLNFGTVYIRIGDRQLTFDEVYKPSDVQRELFHRLAEVIAEEKKSQAEAERLRLGDWFATFNDWERKNIPGHTPSPPNQPPNVQGGF